MKITYQTDLTDAVGISQENVDIQPIIIDYTTFYKYNQPGAFGLITTAVKNDGVNYISEPDIITADNILITDRLFNNMPVYYQYQLGYDVLVPENIKAYNSKDELINFQLEYAYLKNGLGVINTSYPYPLAKNYYFIGDSLDGCTTDGYTDPGTMLAFGSVQTYDVAPNLLPFKVYGSCLINGNFYYTGSQIKDYITDKATVSLHFQIKQSGLVLGDSYPLIERREYTSQDTYTTLDSIKLHYYSANEYSLDFYPSGVFSSGIAINTGVGDKSNWYRFTLESDMDYDYALVENLTTPATPATNISIAGSFFNNVTTKDRFYFDASAVEMFDLGFFNVYINSRLSTLYGLSYSVGEGYNNEGTLIRNDATITYPLFTNLYSKSIGWSLIKPVLATGVPIRVRLLFTDDVPAYVVYDGIKTTAIGSCTTTIMRNIKEQINYRLVYKKYANYAASDWNMVGTKIYLYNELNDRVVLDQLVYVKQTDTNMRVYYNNIDEQIHVTNGQFNNDSYNEYGVIGDGAQDYYYIPEYTTSMVFAGDNQGTFQPYYIRACKEIAKILDVNKIQLEEFFAYEGNYPDYIIPNFPENDDATLNTIPLNYKSARGINIYKNGVLQNNDTILDYDINNGIIEFTTRLSATDIIQVTYLKKAPDFILKYPIFDNLIVNRKNFRLFLRPMYPTYDTINPNDLVFDRMCYKILNDDGTESGEYISCTSGNPILYESVSGISPHKSRIIKIADIILITDVLSTDIRNRGGGIVDLDEVKARYPYWPAFTDIGYSVNGKLIYNSIIFVQIPTWVKDNMTTNYYGGIEADAVRYIKQSIEQYLAYGVFYVILDENNNPWLRPYPLTITGEK